ncbi:MAG: BON domain-containing protein [Burkholderiales bacterium]|nr:BON domain-containing protein [Burkholderiales bacterium]
MMQRFPRKQKPQCWSNPDLTLWTLNVDMVGGVVPLAGFVDSQASRDKAQQIAGAVSGVRQVENRLIVWSPK